MPDTTGCATKLHGELARANAQKYGPDPEPPGPCRTERTGDDDYADVLVRMWSLVTGRIPRQDVRPCQLTEQELLWFWDDVPAPAGRHEKAALVPSARCA